MKCEVCGVDVTWWHPEYDLTRVPTHVDVEESIRRKGNHYPRVDRSAIPQLGLPRRRDAVTPRCLDVRWQCRGCGRFLAPSAVHSEDRVDPGAYYGVSSRTWADCGRCGEVEEPRCVSVGYVAVPLPEEPR